MSIDQLTLPAQRIFAVMHRGAYTQISTAFTSLHAAIMQTSMAPKVQGLVALYFDDPQRTPVAELRSAAGVVVAEDLACVAPLSEIRLDAGSYARRVHQGSYDGLGASWATFLADLAQANIPRAAGPALEHYLNSPMETPTHALQTALLVPLHT